MDVIIREGIFVDTKLILWKKIIGETILEGYFANDVLISGRMTFQDGLICEGKFDGDKFIEGTITYSNGKFSDYNCVRLFPHNYTKNS